MKKSAKKKSNEAFTSDLDLKLSIGTICMLCFSLVIFFSATSQEEKKKKSKTSHLPRKKLGEEQSWFSNVDF